ncbi:PREDICTED: uncharacterized protein LOC109114376 [Nelumbo nucifera]|uniref:Uncharacterized protein LOC109114376 n=1 Tax=Nelumbo nucifera TaxID=4432 RepID=A0A1U8Q0W5_NELNU|nr:PREDICTED: uncharacterized protein LOC109114376 [Nelumbo nucifera]
MAPTSRLSKFQGDPFPDPTQYRSIVGALQYVTHTQPDVAFTVNKACQFLQNPTNDHWTAVKYILHYLKDSTSNSLGYLVAFSDADWAGCLDYFWSTGGYGIFLGSHLISWSVKKQPTIARSSIEADFCSLANTTIELLWLQSLLWDLGIHPSVPPILYCEVRMDFKKDLMQQACAKQERENQKVCLHFVGLGDRMKLTLSHLEKLQQAATAAEEKV